MSDLCIRISVNDQRLFLCCGEDNFQSYTISSAFNGIGCEEGSFKTPIGHFKIHSMIGSESPINTVFIARNPTYIIWGIDDNNLYLDDLVLTRVMVLEGMEEGVNRGVDPVFGYSVDTLSRNIYIHGTNFEDCLGTPASHGCIRMGNEDVIELFDNVDVGTDVFIM